MKVLIVDDDADVRDFMVSCMKTLECEKLDTAESGEEALAKAVQGAYDLVTLDIKMAGVSGLDILSVIRGMMPWSVIAIISGYTHDVPETVREYADLVLSKPVRVNLLQDLFGLTRELVDKRGTIRELGADA